MNICLAHYKQKSLGAGVSVNQANTSLTPVRVRSDCLRLDVVQQLEMPDRQDE